MILVVKADESTDTQHTQKHLTITTYPQVLVKLFSSNVHRLVLSLKTSLRRYSWQPALEEAVVAFFPMELSVLQPVEVDDQTY